MIYIPKKLIVIHIPRSGGTSFGRRILGQLFKVSINTDYKNIKYISNILPLKSGIQVYGYNYRFEKRSSKSENLWKHSTALEILNYLGVDEWNRCYKIAISKRNIYDRIASYYFHKVKINKINHKKYSEVLNLSFKEYIMSEAFDKKDNILNYISDGDGKIIIDKIVDFDNLNNEFENLSKDIFNVKMSFSHQNKGNKKLSYKDVYDTEMVEKIKNLFKDEIEYFNWQI